MVLLFSFLLLAGTIAGQSFDFSPFRHILGFITSACLAFIMIEVGTEFSSEDRTFKSYGKDFLIASTAAILPALLCFLYFCIMLQSHWKSAMLMGISFAPTSAGILFAMLMAAGLSASWVYKKARVLAVLDDLVTILLLTPLEIIIHGLKVNSFVTLGLVSACIFASFRWKNMIPWPTSKPWLLFYSVLLAFLVSLIEHKASIHLEVLIPAFMLGCCLKMQHEQQAEVSPLLSLDTMVKGLFMLFVGLTFPKVALGTFSLSVTLMHVIGLTVLANMGKFFLVFCYKNEATLKERMALGIAMFPRGEVGAAVLLIGLAYGIGIQENTLAFLSLSLNLVMTGFFIWMVIKLLKQKPLPQ